MPSTAASSSSASMARSSNRATSVRNARPARSSGPMRACHRVSYGLSAAASVRSWRSARRQHFGGIASAEQAVVDAAAGRWLGESGGIADGHDAVRVGALHRRERQHLEPRAGRRELSSVALAETARVRLNRIAAAVGRHQPNARHRDVAARERHDPREPARRQAPVQIDLDVVHARKRHLELGALQIRARNAEAELAVEAILRAAGQHADAAANRVLAIPDRDANGDAGAHLERRHPGAAQNRRTGAGRHARPARDRSGRDRRRPPPRRRRRCGCCGRSRHGTSPSG